MSELRRLFFTRRFLTAGIVIVLPAFLVWLAITYYGTVFLSGQWLPVQKQSVIDAMSFDQKNAYVKGFFWWLCGFLGLGFLTVRFVLGPVMRFDALVLKVVSPNHAEVIAEYDKLADNRDRMEGPDEVRWARRRLARWEKEPKRLDRYYRLSAWRLLGKPKEWIVERERKKITEWEANR